MRMGGAQRVLSLMMKALSDRGYVVSVITNLPSSVDFFSVDDNIKRYVTGHYSTSKNIMQAIVNNFRRIREIHRYIKKESPNTVFSFMTETNIATILATRLTDVKVVISERSDPVKDKKSAMWNMLRKITYRKADVISSNSKSALEYLGKIVEQHKLMFLPNPIMACIKESTDTSSEKKIILLAGRLKYVKGFDILIEALTKVKTDKSEYQVWIAGNGSEQKNLMNQAVELHVDSNIRWLGQVEDLHSLYNSASIFILPSRREGMPNALIEAMSCGVAVIISDSSPGPLEFVRDGETGLVFDANSSTGLASAIDLLLSDGAKRRFLGDNSIEAMVPFHIDNVLPLWEAAID